MGQGCTKLPRKKNRSTRELSAQSPKRRNKNTHQNQNTSSSQTDSPLNVFFSPDRTPSDLHLISPPDTSRDPHSFQDDEEEEDSDELINQVLEDDYELGEELGSSATEFSVIFQAVSRKTGEKVAVKCITKHPRTENEHPGLDKYRSDPDRARALQRDVCHLKQLQHPNLIKVFDSYIDDEIFYLVTEFFEDEREKIFGYISNRPNFNERHAREICSQIMDAVNYLHSQNIVHTDLRPEQFRILRKEGSQNVLVKLKDLGFVKKTIAYHLPSVLVWSPYSSPEVTQRTPEKDMFAADMWSLGIFFYEIMCGVSPFFGNDFETTTQLIIQAEWGFAGEAWNIVSFNAKNLISLLLVRNPSKRLKAKDSARHRWFLEELPTETPPLKTFQIRNQFADLFAKERKLAFVEDGIEMFYKIGKQLGRGGYSEVLEAVHKTTGDRVAIKCVDKPPMPEAEDMDDEEDEEEEIERETRLRNLKREILIMKTLQHPNIVKLFDVFMDPTKYYLILELMPNCKELYENIIERGYYSESSARHVIAQILHGLDYLHSRGIAHRDLKPENILCAKDSTRPNREIVKLTDFGFAKIFADDKLVTAVGSPNYAAPELFTGMPCYERSIDMWSIGVIIYVILCGYPPFNGENLADLTKKILVAHYEFDDDPWPVVSDSAKDLIQHLIVKEPSRRYSTKNCLNHDWILQGIEDLFS
eukprot:TRINITY_DN941_c0_g1_i3.p1 TRINITY_DN941_c0_g1~~TRINITY_DN941_c0_g1_i3.p1  ORF type:complete len:701 (-),score=131.14 TRINITY_DN941_c0_g1_i3:521-2623(-)